MDADSVDNMANMAMADTSLVEERVEVGRWSS